MRCQMRVMFRWADEDNFHAITDEQALTLFNHVRQAAPGLVHRKQVMATLPRLKRDHAGRVPLLEFTKLCGHWPYLYFPLARLQVRLLVETCCCMCRHRGVAFAGPAPTPNHGQEILAQEQTVTGS